MIHRRFTGGDRAAIRNAIAAQFNMDELRIVCSDLGIDHEDIPSSTKPTLIDELLRHCERRSIVSGLLRVLTEHRRQHDWRATFTDGGLLTRDAVSDDFVIIDVASILDHQLEDIERPLGSCITRTSRGINSAEELPMGGEAREYAIGGFTVSINYDRKGTARGVQVIKGLAECGYSLDHWPVVTCRLGMTMLEEPQILASAARKWNDFNGLSIHLVANRPNGLIWTARVFQNLGGNR